MSYRNAEEEEEDNNIHHIDPNSRIGNTFNDEEEGTGNNNKNTTIPTKFQRIQIRLIPILNLVSFIIVVIVNALASAGVINNVNTGKVSDEYATSITPAGYAFSIWGLIYTFVAITILINIVQSLILGRNNVLINEKMSYLFSINSILNCCWMIVWQYSARGNTQLLWFTLVFMILILATLIAMYVRVGVNYFEPSKKEHKDFVYASNNSTLSSILSWKNTPCNFWEYWIIQPMLSLYMGWISVATIVNVSIALTANLATKEENMFERTLWGVDEAMWSCMLHGVIVCLGLIFLHWRRDVVFAGVFTWALFAISSKQKASPQVSICAGVCGAILGFFVLYTTALNVVTYVGHYGGFSGTWKHVSKSVRKSFKRAQ